MNELKVNVYTVLERCISEGIERGWNRAYKHTDEPSGAIIKEEIKKYILLSICDYFNFDEWTN